MDTKAEPRIIENLYNLKGEKTRQQLNLIFHILNIRDC
jgi:hypothetical protein